VDFDRDSAVSAWCPTTSRMCIMLSVCARSRLVYDPIANPPIESRMPIADEARKGKDDMRVSTIMD